jgi:CheY-like chemotaxis protein
LTREYQHKRQFWVGTCFRDWKQNLSKPLSSFPHQFFDCHLRPSSMGELSVTTTAPKSVLIVDDNAFIREGLSELFNRETDFQVCGEAQNGKDAIEKAQELHPDLIVLDLSMPVMNGFDAARALKRLMPAVLLIMYSAFGDRFAEHQVRLIGISEVVSKSEHASVLIHKARGLLYSKAA